MASRALSPGEMPSAWRGPGQPGISALIRWRSTESASSATPSSKALARSAQTVMPDLKQASKSLQQITKSAQDTMPKIDQTAEEFQKLAKAARQSIPEFERTNDELQVTVRNFGALAERVDVFLATNQDRISRAVDQTTDLLQRMSNVLSEENRRNLEVAIDCALKQRMIPGRFSVEELFA